MKCIREQYFLSAKVHMDEETPHMHLVFIPVVHTQDKKGNNIDKIACSEFGKEKERQSILAENKEIKENFKTLENDYAIKLKQEIRKFENKYEDEIYNLKKENRFLNKIINIMYKYIVKKNELL